MHCALDPFRLARLCYGDYGTDPVVRRIVGWQGRACEQDDGDMLQTFVSFDHGAEIAAGHADSLPCRACAVLSVHPFSLHHWNGQCDACIISREACIGRFMIATRHDGMKGDIPVYLTRAGQPKKNARSIDKSIDVVRILNIVA